MLVRCYYNRGLQNERHYWTASKPHNLYTLIWKWHIKGRMCGTACQNPNTAQLVKLYTHNIRSTMLPSIGYLPKPWAPSDLLGIHVSALLFSMNLPAAKPLVLGTRNRYTEFQVLSPKQTLRADNWWIIFSRASADFSLSKNMVLWEHDGKVYM